MNSILLVYITPVRNRIENILCSGIERRFYAMFNSLILIDRNLYFQEEETVNGKNVESLNCCRFSINRVVSIVEFLYVNKNCSN